MTSQSPRIYIYKITFEEVPYYYYGVHKEKYFNEEYWGSPKTNKWCWEIYTPKKQILQLFDFTDECWLEARKIEIRIIKPVLNNKWCLNENCGGIMSLDVARKNGLNAKEMETGIHSFSKEKRREIALKSIETNKKNSTGIFGLTREDRIKYAKEVNALGGGFSSILKEDRKRNSYIGGIKSYQLGLGIHSLTKEQQVQNGKKVGEWNKENTSKEFCVISPEGVIINGKNVREFCRRENLNRRNFIQLLNGNWKQYKGWKLAH